MNEINLEQIWKEMTDDNFETFIKANVGYKEDPARGSIPKCFGSGDDRPWCFNCALKVSC